MTESEKNPGALLKALREREIAYCKGDAAYFVETYCKIEDRDAPGIMVPFALWPAQKQVLHAFCTHRRCIVLKARQLGLTWLVLCFGLHRMLAFPGSTVVALSRTETEAAELVRRLTVLMAHMPELIGREKQAKPGQQYGYKATAGLAELTGPGGLVSSFRAFPSSPGAVRSFTASLLILDEWAFQQHARQIWASAFPAVNREQGGQVIGLSTMRRGSLFEEIFTGENDFKKIFLPWRADPRRTEGWYEETRRQLGFLAMQEYPATPEEAMRATGGAFFPELREYIHLRSPEPVLPGYRRYVALDYGLDMLAACWIYVDFQGFERGYRELFREGLIVSEAAKALLAANGGDPVHQWLAPPDLWNRNRDTGKSTADIFREHGIPLTRVSNDREQGWLDLKEHLLPITRRSEQTGESFSTARLTFDRGALPETWRCLSAIRQDRANPKDAAREPHELTHITDALRYFAAAAPARQKKRAAASSMNQCFRRGKKNGPTRPQKDTFTGDKAAWVRCNHASAILAG